jgi:uncharacterized protein (DUF1810 family)
MIKRELNHRLNHRQIRYKIETCVQNIHEQEQSIQEVFGEKMESKSFSDILMEQLKTKK